MVALSLTHAQPRRRTQPVAVLSFLVLLIAVLTAAHAVERHGADALAVRQCVDHGPTLNYKSTRQPGRFYRLCQLPDGRWGLQIVDKLGRTFQEITSFVRGDGSWDEVSNYVLRAATRFKGPL